MISFENKEQRGLFEKRAIGITNRFFCSNERTQAEFQAITMADTIDKFKRYFNNCIKIYPEYLDLVFNDFQIRCNISNKTIEARVIVKEGNDLKDARIKIGYNMRFDNVFAKQEAANV